MFLQHLAPAALPRGGTNKRLRSRSRVAFMGRQRDPALSSFTVFDPGTRGALATRAGGA
jgi:hypothetical protein